MGAKLSLYEISSELERIREHIHEVASENEGEIPRELDEILTDMEGEKSEKVLNIARLIKSELATAATIKTEEQNLRARRQVHENLAERLKEYLERNIPGESYEDASAKISWRKSERVEIEDLFNLPGRFVEFPPHIPTPKKAEIKKALRDGLAISGASLQSFQNLQIK